MKLRGARAVVVGLGASGRAAAKVLVDEGARVVVSERRPLRELEDVGLDVDVRAGGHEQEHLDGADLVVVSPGVPERAPIIEWSRRRRIPIWSELELGWRVCEARLRQCVSGALFQPKSAHRPPASQRSTSLFRGRPGRKIQSLGHIRTGRNTRCG